VSILENTLSIRSFMKDARRQSREDRMNEPKSNIAAASALIRIGIVAAGLCSVPASYAASAADCAAEADRVSRDQGTMLGGAGRGAVRGAAFGAIVGGGNSAGRGAAVGAIVGTARTGAQKNETYNQVYDSCMRR
jgi:hypothetical protein